MALASGHWIEKDSKGQAPSPRFGHALAVAGDVAFVFGGAALSPLQDGPLYLNDFHMLTVSSQEVMWEQIPHTGRVPSPREGPTLCVVKGKLFLFGGVSSPEDSECLSDVYSFDIVSLEWSLLEVKGRLLKTLRHCSASVRENIYVYGGTSGGTVSDDLLVFNTVSLKWTPVKTSGSVPPALWGQSCAVVGEQIFMFGGFGSNGDVSRDLYLLLTESLVWQKFELRGESPAPTSGHSLCAHHEKDLYLFGGKLQSEDGAENPSNEIHKLSLVKMKWKVPLYVGVPPTRRHGHTAFVLHSHLYVFGGRDKDQDFNDLKVMKLINPSERQPVLKGILSEFGLQGVGHSFTPTKIPNVRYDITESLLTNQSTAMAASPQATVLRDFGSVRDEAMRMIQNAFHLLDQELTKLDRDRAELTRSGLELQRDRENLEALRQQQQQEVRDMVERHRAQNEAWLRARAEENDRERRELSRIREEVVEEQQRLKEEQESVQKRSEHLLTIMQQFKGM
ncbi:uncharacterized protein zmp:0000001301 [Periophthalmus magnuspinnatus]|uniref:uncharacterized protein zmp:0000001301 n=1 Tax=Periophthalmus magnuspinnatus TaxID=409849 RepID=UPI002436F762|nr:uncharacterized protein zmp:0000001301 [Periophthalmus magnuspinnatus]